MSMVEPTANCLECRYAAAHCVVCGSNESLRLVDGKFRCSDPKACVEYREAVRRANEAADRLEGRLL